MSENLSRIKRVELRNAWKHEATDFTSWLAMEENLRLLGDEIGIEIRLVQTEATVGKFNVDILAEEENTGHKIVIENQLESTNHDHLGKIITYASGVDAKIVIWVVKEAREEHRQAIDWLNEHTDEDLLFFLVQIELWQIADSPMAPKFEIISKPNDWAKVIRQSIGSVKVTDTKQKQFEFWESFKEYANTNKTSLRFQKSYPQHWTNVSIGSSHAHISFTINSFDEAIRTELYIPDNKEMFHYLEGHRDEIESELGQKAEWMELPESKASRIKVEIKGSIDKAGELEKYYVWMRTMGEKFQKVFSGWLKKHK